MTDTSRGIALMIGAILCFSMMDVMAKFLAGRVDPVVAIFARYLGQSILVTVLVLPRLRQVARTKHPVAQVVRAVLLMSATGCFYTAFAYMPLTEVTALIQVGPVLITLGAAVFLGEALGPRRIAGIIVALFGAMIILRPGSDVFQIYALLPLFGTCCYAGYTLITRRYGRAEDPMTSLLFTAVIALGLSSLLMPFRFAWPDTGAYKILVGLTLCGSLGQFLLIRALMVAQAGVLAPFGYIGMVFAALWGLVIFNERPDATTLIGAVVIIAAGLYVWHREYHDRQTSL